MSLSEAAANMRVSHPGGRCSVAVLLDRLDDADRTWLTARLAEPAEAVQHSWLSRVLAQDGHKIAGQTLSRHRSGECSCP